MKKIFLFFISLLFILPCYCEIIILKSGKTVEGKIIERTEGSVKVDISGIPVTYYLDEIESIDGQKIIAPSKDTKPAPSNSNKTDSLQTKVDNGTAVEKKSVQDSETGEEADVIRKLPFSTAIITYKYTGFFSGKEKFYIDATNKRSAQEIEKSGTMLGQPMHSKAINICYSKVFYHIDLDKKHGMRQDLEDKSNPLSSLKGDFISMFCGNEQKSSKYYSGEKSFLGKQCNVYESPSVIYYFWNGIILKEEARNHPHGAQYNYTREAVSIQLDVKLPPEKFQVPEGIKIISLTDALTGLSEMIKGNPEAMKGVSQKMKDLDKELKEKAKK